MIDSRLPRFVRLACLTVAGLSAAVPFGFGQTQPPEATNSQDERVNINRDVGDRTDMFKILRSGDKSETNQYVSKVYRLKNANPFEILPYIRSMARLEKGGVATAFNPDPGSGDMRAWIQVSVPEFLIPSIDQAIALYDVEDFKSSPGDVRISYRTQHRGVKEVADFIRAADLSGDGRIVADEPTNSLYLIDSPSDFSRVISTIQFFDVQVPEVDVELQLVELTEVDQTELGLDWDAWKTSLGGALDVAWDWTRVDPAGADVARSSARSFSGLASVGATALADFLNYMVDRGKAEIVANTHLTILNRETGFFSSTTEVPEYNYVYGNAQDLNVLTEEDDRPDDPKFEGLEVRITPDIAMGCTRLNLELLLRSPVAVGKSGNPIYSEQRVDTTIIASSDELFKVGGLKRGVVTTNTKGLPGLKSIPGLRYLFSEETYLVRKTELYLFVKPTWASPQIAAVKALAGSEALEEFPYTVEGILKKNPNVRVTPEDRRVLDQYFSEQAR